VGFYDSFWDDRCILIYTLVDIHQQCGGTCCLCVLLWKWSRQVPIYLTTCHPVPEFCIHRGVTYFSIFLCATYVTGFCVFFYTYLSNKQTKFTEFFILLAHTWDFCSWSCDFEIPALWRFVTYFVEHISGDMKIFCCDTMGILVLIYLQIEEKGLDALNVREVLLEMRKFRMGLIQTPDQLRFSYWAIIEGSNKYPNGSNVVSKVIILQ